MANSRKVKGTAWERKAVEILKEKLPGSVWKRIPGSGAIGTIMGEPLLGGDIAGKIFWLPKTFRAEAKVGYGGSTYMKFNREWLAKIAEEAERTHSYPLMLGKFTGARGRSKHFVAMDFEAFVDLLMDVKKIYDAEVKATEELENLKRERDRGFLEDG